MERMDDLKPEIARLIAAKERRRSKLAALSFPEKVRIVVRMQQMVEPIMRARRRPLRVWEIEDLKPER